VKIKATAVSYLNTKPLLWGLFKNDIGKQLDLALNIPSVCAQLLRDGEVDLALVPVAIIPEIPNAEIISDYCIGSDGAVQTVCIYSNVPVEEIDNLFLDHHSRTSVELVQILLKEYWKCEPNLLTAEEGYIQQISGTTAGLVIGDRTIGLEKKFKYVYDLGEHWTKHTGLPFVFAAWVARKPLPIDFIQRFNAAVKEGLSQLPELMHLLPSPKNFDLEAYLTHYISYDLTAQKKKALQLFLTKMQSNRQGKRMPSLV